MTWARVRATGSGLTEFDLEIAGCPYVITTDTALDGTTDGNGREFVSGLQRDGLVTEETLELNEPRCRARGPTANIVDVRGRATRLFARTPTKVAYLAANLSVTATTVQVSQALFANGDVIHIGTEAMLVTGGGNTTTLTVVRGHWGSVAQAHYIEDGAAMRTPEVTDWPASIEGRAVRLRVYGESEATPTVIWRGRVARDAGMTDLSTWSILLDSPMSALAQPLGDDVRGDQRLRGIVYSAGFPFTLFLASGSNTATIEFGPSGGESPESIPGVLAFFRSQRSFVDALSSAIVSATSSWGAAKLVDWGDVGRSLRAVVDEETGGWRLVYRTALAGNDLVIRCQSPVDFGGWGFRRGTFFIRNALGIEEIVDAPLPNTTHYFRFEPTDTIESRVPRGAIGNAGYGHRGDLGPLGLVQRHLFLESPIGTVTSVRIDDFPAVTVESYDSARNALVLDAEEARRPGIRTLRYGALIPMTILYSGASPRIVAMRSYGEGDLADLLSRIVAAAPSESARGAVPWIEAGEVNLTSTVVAAETALERGAPAWVRRRRLELSEPVDLEEALAHEAALLGGVIAPGAGGLVQLTLLEPRAATDLISATIDEDALIDDGPPALERSSHGVVNTVAIDLRDGAKFRVRDVTAFGRCRMPRVMKIEPVFHSPLEATATAEDAAAVARPWFSFLARPYSVATVRVDYRYFGSYIGDAVLLTSTVLPNAQTGERSITQVPGIVVGRRWDHARGVGELRVLLSHGRLAGYTPTSRILSATLVSGTTYDLTIDSPPSIAWYAGVSAWSVGDAVIVRSYDSASPGEVHGTITSIAGNVVRAALSAAVPAGTLDLRYDWAPYIQSSQRPYAWIADAVTRNEGLIPARPAREYL